MCAAKVNRLVDQVEHCVDDRKNKAAIQNAGSPSPDYDGLDLQFDPRQRHIVERCLEGFQALVN